jgi:outer membrane receptor protein involved in Fe transport
MKKIISIFLLSVIFAFSQKTSLTGVITDKNTGNPLIGANVIINGSGLNTGAATDFNGHYTIKKIPEGPFDIKVTYIGYSEFKGKINISTQSPNTFNVQLSVSAIQLQEYVVTASRGKREKITDAPAAISIISELKIRNASNPNLGDYFKNIKGVDFTASGLDSYNLSARGFNSSFSSRLLTLTDGRMANVPSLRLIAYNVIPLTSDDVKQIEVVLGPSSSLYGPNAHAGVVNIISKRPQESLGTVIGFTGGTRNFAKAQVRHSQQIGNFAYKVSLVNFSAHDWEYIEHAERTAHYNQWQNVDFGDGDKLDDYFEDGNAWWKGWDIEVDRDGDGIVDTTYLGSDNIIRDRNNDGVDDMPNFDIKNTRFDLRMDYDFSPEHFVSLNYGFAQATNINITGIGRYLADDWIYQFFQTRWIYKNWFAQAYLNTSISGTTRNMRTGGVVWDQSKFFHLQFQHNLDFNFLNTKLIWGGDYQRTMPKTFGTILPDGSGGNNPISFDEDGKDNDGDGEIDEWDELFVTNEFGLYGQSQSKLSDHFELIISGRIDLHSGLLDENGIPFILDPLTMETANFSPQISPKFGLMWKPKDNQTFRLTAARAFNTPSSQGLYLDVLAAQYSIFPVKARGNKDGYGYTRNTDGNLMMYDVRDGSRSEFRWANMPEKSVLFIPAVLGRPHAFVHEEDYKYLDPVRSEEVWTYEFGYAGFVGERTRATFDFYYSKYSDFVSDLTWVTPVVLDTSNGFYSVDNPDPAILGFIPTSNHSGIKDGGDGIPGAYYIERGSSKWSIIPSGWWNKDPAARKGTELVISNGDTLGAWWSDDSVDFDNPVNLMLTNINYGAVSLWGLDASFYTFITPQITADINFSYLGKTRFWNFLTRDYDPINAPKFKVNGKLAYNSEIGFHGNIGFRYIPEFEWAAGVHYGIIEQYLVVDSMVGYRFGKRYDLLLNINNLNGDVHREIVGGPKLGRHITLKLNARF